jgi:hypothetical protein
MQEFHTCHAFYCILLVNFWLIYLFLECSLYITSLHLQGLIYFRHMW